MASRSAIKASSERSRGCGTGSGGGSRSSLASSLRNGSRSRCPTSQSGRAMNPTTRLRTFAAPWRTRSWRCVLASDSHTCGPLLRGSGTRFEAPANRLDDHLTGAVEISVGPRNELEDPAGEQLLDRAVEPHRGELGVHVLAERPGPLGIS